MILEEKWKWFEENNPWFAGEMDESPEYKITEFGWVDLNTSSVCVGFGGHCAVNSWDEAKGEEDSILEDYFQDWKAPTEKELIMFEMLFGVRLPWNETNPLRFP